MSNTPPFKVGDKVTVVEQDEYEYGAPVSLLALALAKKVLTIGSIDSIGSRGDVVICTTEPDYWNFHPSELVLVTGASTATERKQTPVATGVIDYFPDAILAIARLSFVGNEQHNPGTALHWDRAKSGDESDALMRHFIQRGTVDTDGVRHSTKVAWRALANLQKELEAAK